MSDRRVMEVLRSRTCKYEIVRVSSGVIFSGYDFYVIRDGRQIGGPYRDYPYAIEVAKKDGAR